MPPRKPPAKVLSLLTGSPLEPDVITEADLREAVIAQDNVLYAQGYERRVLGKLRVRIERGAAQSSKKYYFDLDRGIVRRRERVCAPELEENAS
jgi:hypothetical protein